MNARRLRAAIYGASAALVAWAGLVVPFPFVEYVPGPITDLPALVVIEGVETGEISGQTSMLTVTLRQQPAVQSLRAALDGDRDLHRVEQIYPPDLEREEYLELQRDRFGRQFEIAAAVGAQAAGYETELRTEVVVVDVAPNSPAEDILQIGDVVLSVDGTGTVASEDLQNMVRSREVGDEVALEIRRNDTAEIVHVRLGPTPDADFPRLGVAIQTAVDELVLPFEVRLAQETRIGGPSAGLMFGLTVYDMLADEDLVAGRVIAGTGSLDADGTVGPVGGVAEKVRAAIEYGADIVLVPEFQVDQAASAGGDITVIGVASFDEALEALRNR